MFEVIIYVHDTKLKAVFVCKSRPSLTILEPEDQEIVEFYEVQDRRSTDFEALTLQKGRSGYD